MNLRTLIFLTCFTLFAHSAFCQSYGYHEAGKSSMRSYFGIDYPMMKLTMQQNYTIDRSAVPNSGPNVDTTINTIKKSPGKPGIKNVIGMIGGLSFKLAKTGKTSMLALDVAATIDLYTWNIGTVRYSVYDSAVSSVFCVQSNIPIALMLKVGPEATLDSKDKTMFSIGAGFCPSFAGASYDQSDGGYFKLRTFLVTELGINFGLALKLRAVYYPGTVSFLDFTGNDLPGYNTSGNQTVTASGSGNFVLSLVVMLRSNQWSNDRY